MLKGAELNLLFSQVFGYSASEFGHRIGFLVDVPSAASEDTPQWRERRILAMQWARALAKTSFHACMVYAYESVGRGSDFIHLVYNIPLLSEIPDHASQLGSVGTEMVPVGDVYSRAEFWIALTQVSVTGILKIAAARYGFRAAALPGFSNAMLPSLCVDVSVVDLRTRKLAQALTDAQWVSLDFDVKGRKYSLTLDLRYRMGFASNGRFRRNGQTGTLPAGESYIVPYEGEKNGIVSMSEGIFPITHGGDIALCEVSENRVVCIDGRSAWAETLRQSIAADPARANVAELGLGILGEWDIQPVGQMLHDELLGIHVALGRSDHIGGVTAPADFKAIEHVQHVDYIFHRALMPEVSVVRGSLGFEDREAVFYQNGRYIYDDL